jgi:SAM domain (Sterile alpha motif)
VSNRYSHSDLSYYLVQLTQLCRLRRAAWTVIDLESAAEPPTAELELKKALTQLGLGQYEEGLKENGFDDGDTVTAITEADLAELGFGLGDRCKLQRAICEYNISSTPGAESRTATLPLSLKHNP